MLIVIVLLYLCSLLIASPIHKTKRDNGAAQSIFTLTDSNSIHYFESNQDNNQLILFYAPNCQPCEEFKVAYARASEVLFKHILLGNIENMTVVMCDVSNNPVVAQRFKIATVPSVFYHRGPGNSYKYDRVMEMNPLVDFVVKGYEEALPIPIEEDPFGIYGDIKELLLKLIPNRINVTYWLNKFFVFHSFGGIVCLILGTTGVILVTSIGIAYVYVQ